MPTLPRALWNFLYLVLKGVWLHYRAGRVKAIVAYGPFTPALAGFVVRALTGAKLIVDFPGNPTNSFLLGTRTPSRLDRIKTRISLLACPWVAKSADHVRLLYRNQLDALVRLADSRTSAFHYFTPIEHLHPCEHDSSSILCLGGPWHRKGVDLLIRAFLEIADEFPDVSLRVHGHTREKEYYESLAAGHERIQLGGPVAHSEALELIRTCRVFACPSRSEGFPRVIVEAMAAARPVVASDVDGIPYYLKDGETGLIFKTDDVHGLALKLRMLLADRQLAHRLGAAARAYAMQKLTDSRYAEAYKEMVDRTLSAVD
jgi:glycosyltransferase involved in cell wall biosynthesis